jgi:methylated-DNA-[protein]-cysteine S-methyltransferase
MSGKPAVCREIEPDLVASASGDADAPATARVTAHVGRCAPCREELGRYRSIDALAGALSRETADDPRAELARQALQSRLADLRRRFLVYGIFGSPLGRLLIARSEEGVALVEYLSGRGLEGSRLARAPGVEATEDPGEIEALHRQLLDYLSGQRTRLDWPLDLRLAGSGFQREVLRLTAALPYGAVTSYGHLAGELGRPAAVRAVAQALRHNPLPIVVPCHRVIGGSGSLTGYAGHRIGLKERLLALEGVPTAAVRHDVRIARGRMYCRADHDAEYCLPTCGSLSTMPLARLTLFGTRERAEAAGLAPCTTCRPDVHPLPASA